MPPAADTQPLPGPIVVELDDDTWKDYLDSTEQWLGNVLMLQSAFREMAQDVQGKVDESHFRELLADVAEAARRHEQRVDELYRIIGRDPAKWRKTAGTMTAKLRQGWADLVGMAGGGSSPWRDLQQLYISNLNAISAFGAAEQLGYSLGLPGLADACFEIIAEKHAHHLLIQELTLEVVPRAILYKTGT